MKKIISVIICAACLLSFSGCSPAHPAVQGVLDFLVKTGIVKEGKNELLETARTQSAVTLECLKTGESEELIGLFCSATAFSHDLDEEIEGAILFLDGDIVDDGELFYWGYSSKYVEDYETVLLRMAPIIEEVTTDSGAKYDITIYSCLVNAKKESDVGVSHIVIRNNENDEAYVIGG